MSQRDLIRWYIAQQNEKNQYSSEEEAKKEITVVKSIIEVSAYIVCELEADLKSLQTD